MKPKPQQRRTRFRGFRYMRTRTRNPYHVSYRTPTRSPNDSALADMLMVFILLSVVVTVVKVFLVLA